jgi:hypothetical protein
VSCEKAENEVSFDERRAVFGAMMMMADAIVSDVYGGGLVERNDEVIRGLRDG